MTDAQEISLGFLQRLQSSRPGIFVLRTMAAICFGIVVFPLGVAIYLGNSTDWFVHSIQPGTMQYEVVIFLEAKTRSPDEITTTLLAAFPAVAFLLAFAGKRKSTLNWFGATLLVLLLIGLFVGVWLGIFLSEGGRQLPCEEPGTCMQWLSNRCSEAGRQCLTYFILILGFDRATK